MLAQYMTPQNPDLFHSKGFNKVRFESIQLCVFHSRVAHFDSWDITSYFSCFKGSALKKSFLFKKSSPLKNEIVRCFVFFLLKKPPVRKSVPR